MPIQKLQRHGKPRYRVRYNHRVTQQGKRAYSERWFKTLTEARDFDRRVTSLTTATTERLTISDLADVWLDRHVATLKTWTQRSYKSTVNHHIKPHIGGMRVSSLTPRMIRDWQRHVQAETSAATSNKALRTLRAMLRWGRLEGTTETRVADDTRQLPQPEPSPPHPRTPQEIETLARAAELLRDATLIRVGAYSGLRIGELLALEWAAVDLDAGWINVHRALDADGTIKGPKNGPRMTKLLDPGVKALKAYRKKAPDTDLAFPSTTGGPIGNIYRDVVNPIRKASKITDFEPHQLRDTYASILAHAGVTEQIATVWLGHESIQTTRKHYLGLVPEMADKLAERANAFLRSL